MRTGFVVASLVAFGIIVGCGGGTGSTGSTGGASVSGMCQSFCDWRVRCAKQDQDCQNECTSDLTRNFDKLSGAYTNMFVTCFQGLACTESDDACIANFAAADPAYPNIPEVSACMEKRSECSSTTTGPDGGTSTSTTVTFSDDYCLSIAALGTAARAQADTCRSQPCGGVRDCLIQAGAFNY